MALKVTWIGGASFVFEDPAGRVVFLDPWLDADGGSPGCPLKVADVARADLVLVTHGDPSHWGRGDAVRVAAKTGCPFMSNPPLCEYVVRKGFLPASQVMPLPLNERRKMDFMEVMSFPVIHPHWDKPEGYDIPNDPNTGFSLSMGGVSVLYTGDTVLGDEVYRGIAAAYPPRVGLLPIGSARASHGSLNETVEIAASIAGMIGAEYVIPHYRYVPNNPAVSMLADALRPLGVQLVRLEPGQGLSLDRKKWAGCRSL